MLSRFLLLVFLLSFLIGIQGTRAQDSLLVPHLFYNDETTGTVGSTPVVALRVVLEFQEVPEAERYFAWGWGPQVEGLRKWSLPLARREALPSNLFPETTVAGEGNLVYIFLEGTAPTNRPDRIETLRNRIETRFRATSFPWAVYAVVTAKSVVVNSTGDAPRGEDDEGNLLAGCDTGETIERNGVKEAECTVRAIIEAINAGALGEDEIAFDIPEEDDGCSGGVCTIEPEQALPPIEVPVTIDGTTQPGYAGQPRIFLDGAGAGVNSSGLRFVAEGAGSSVKGLAIGNFGWHGILVADGSPDKGVQIDSSFIGVDATGAAPAGNGWHGIYLGRGGGHLIRGSVISANDSSGVFVASNNTTLVGNHIGVDAGGEQALGNGKDGIELPLVLLFNDEADLRIGGGAPEERNVISGNKRYGIYNAGNKLMVQGNRIGTNAEGTAALANEQGGIVSSSFDSSVIGGEGAGAGNLISGNGAFGVYIGDTSFEGGYFPADQRATIQGNRIGTNAAGTAALPNQGPGIVLGSQAGECLVGGTSEGAGNLISGNTGPGLLLDSMLDEYLNEVGILFVGDNFGVFEDGHTVQGNLIGTDVTGTKRLANQDGGIRMFGQKNTVIGTRFTSGKRAFEQEGGRNVIAGNVGPGISIEGVEAGDNVFRSGEFNWVWGNFIGVDITGAKTLGNTGPGIQVLQGPGNSILGNVITGNGVEGVYLHGGYIFRTSIRDNIIGGTASAGAAPGNGGDGIRLHRTTQEEPTVTGDRSIEWLIYRGLNRITENTIIGNGGNGMSIVGQVDRDLLLETAQSIRREPVGIQENWIGTNEAFSEGMGNSGHGLYIEDAVNTEVGTETEGLNVIAYNAGAGIAVASGDGHLFMDNSLFRNGKGGIDLGLNSYTLNDGWDRDGGPNLQQNYPDLQLAIRQGDDVLVIGALSSAQETTYSLIFFTNTPARGCNGRLCQAEDLLAAEGAAIEAAMLSVTTPFLSETTEGPTVPFTHRFRNLAGRAQTGDYVTALAVDPDDNTSELSPGVRIVAADDVRTTPLTEGQTGTLFDDLGITVRVPSSAAAGKTHASADTLYAARHHQASVVNQFAGSATTPAGALIAPGLVAPDRYWSLATNGSAEGSYSVCLDAGGLEALGPVDTFVLLQRAHLGTAWVPQDAYLDATTGQVCADELTGFGDFTVGVGGEAVVAAPMLLTPANNATDVLLSTALTWQPIADAAGYDVQVALDAGFTTLLHDASGITESEVTPSGLERSQIHYWRVRGVTASDEVGPWSVPFRFTTGDTGVSVEDEAEVPEGFALEPNYPNPFNPQTTIGFALPQAADVRLVVYDVLGREVARLVEGTRPAGRHAVVFDATGLPTGVYLYRLQAGPFAQARQMLLVK